MGVERKLVDESKAVAAKLVGARTENVVWCPNLSDAFNAVFKSLNLINFRFRLQSRR